MSILRGDGRTKQPRFPQELFDLIIDCIEDTETLKQFSLAGSDYRLRCKSRLFRTIVLTLPGYKTTIERLDCEALNIYKSVRHVVLRGPGQPTAAILDDEASETSSKGDCADPDTKSDTKDDAPDSNQLDLCKALQDIDQLSAFLQKLTRVEELTIDELSWETAWSRPDALLLPNIIKTVTCVRLERATFTSLADVVVFITSFRGLRFLKIAEVYWRDDHDPIALVKAQEAAQYTQPSINLRGLESWATPSADILSHIMPEETVGEPRLRKVTMDCLHNFEVLEWQGILRRAGEHLKELLVRLTWHCESRSVAFLRL